VIWWRPMEETEEEKRRRESLPPAMV